MRHWLALCLLSVTLISAPAVAKEGINLNSASQEQLQGLNGIGDVLAKRIIEYRKSHDGFSKVQELTKVDGIGAKTLEGIRDRVTVGS